MIYNLMRDVQARFTARKFPVRFEFGPERTKRELYDTAIVMGRDSDKSDGFAPAEGSKGHVAGMIGVRDLAAYAKIYANSSLPGAAIHDHEEYCELLIDALYTELFNWCKEHKRSAPTIPEARYMSGEELGVEVFAGVVYLMRFRVTRGMFVRDYNGADALTGTPAGVGGDLILSSHGTGREVVPMPGK